MTTGPLGDFLMDPLRSLIVTATLPWPAHRFGGPQRSALVLDALRQLGEVDLLLMLPADGSTEPACNDRDHFRVAAEFRAGPPAPGGPWRHLAHVPIGAVARLGGLVAEIEGRYTPDPAAASWLRAKVQAGAYDLIVCRHLRPALLAGADRLRGVPRILDSDDIDWRFLANQVGANPWPGWKGKVAAALAVRACRRVGDAAAGRFDAVWVANDEDRAAIGPARMRGRVRVLPNIPFRPPGTPPIAPCPPRPDSRQIFCLGELGYAPNREGLDHFVARVWPLVRRDQPGATLRIGGGGLDDETRRRWEAAEGVEVAGFVDDLRDAYDRAAFTIAPILWGSGTKIKVIESLAYGRACVATPHALHGYGAHLRHGEHLWRGDTDEGMAEGCTRLLRDPGLRDRLADAGGQVVASRFSDAAFRDEVLATCRALLGRPRR